jgi:uncharacterized membrane protein YcaP (DUF421 family)
MFFDSWTGLVRVVIVGTLAYAGLVLLVRVSGKRTPSRMNAFDLIVTVALGSTVATILLSNDVALAESLVALSLLIGLQFTLTWLSVRSDSVERLIKAEPTLLVYRGELLHGALRRERVTEREVHQALRAKGNASVATTGTVVLETDGTFTVVKHAETSAAPTLAALVDRSEEAA